MISAVAACDAAFTAAAGAPENDDMPSSPAYEMFHRWLAKNRSRIAAPPDRSVVYSGKDGDKPVYKELPSIAKKLAELTGKDPKWVTIEDVLKGIKVDWSAWCGDDKPDPKLLKLAWMWDFACEAGRIGAVRASESQQVWLNLSAWYAKNAKGDIYVVQGATLKNYPDQLLAEFPALLKNKDAKAIDAFGRKLVDLAPSSKKAWERFRADSPKGRFEGRA